MKEESVMQSDTPESLLNRVLGDFKLIEQGASGVHSFEFIGSYPAAEIAATFESLPDKYRLLLWRELKPTALWDVLHLLNYETARHLINGLEQSQLEQLQQLAGEQDLVTFAELLPDAVVQAILSQLQSERAAEVEDALSYGDEAVGRYLNRNIIRCLPSALLSRVKQRISESADGTVDAVVVVGRDHKVYGIINTARALTSPDDTRVDTLLSQVDVVDAKDDMTKVAQTLTAHHAIPWIPVIKQGKVAGVVAIGLLSSRLQTKALEVVTSETGQDEEDLFTPVVTAARMRAFWLVTNLLTAFLASAVIGLFESTVERVVALAILMPVVASMGGIGGSQTLAVALRGIALKHLQRANLKLLLHKELGIALLNGVALGVIIAVLVGLWFGSATLGFIIAFAVMVNSVAAALSGTYIPFILKAMKVDPAIAGSVVLTTVTDVVGFLVFLGLGSLLL